MSVVQKQERKSHGKAVLWIDLFAIQVTNSQKMISSYSIQHFLFKSFR